MRLTELTIAPTCAWKAFGNDNPMKAVVKIGSDHSVVETVLSAETCERLLQICAAEIAENAKRNVDEFVATALAVDHLDALPDARED